jgi:hypothetical protein
MSQWASRNFPGFLRIYGVFFVPWKQFLEFPEFFSHWKYFKKNKSKPFGWARAYEPDPFGSDGPDPRWPIWPGHHGHHAPPPACPLGVHAPHARLRPALYKGRAPEPHSCPSPAAAQHHPPPLLYYAAVGAARRRRRSAARFAGVESRRSKATPPRAPRGWAASRELFSVPGGPSVRRRSLKNRRPPYSAAGANFSRFRPCPCVSAAGELLLKVSSFSSTSCTCQSGT